MSSYRNNSHSSVHSHILLLPNVSVVNVTRSGLSKIRLSAIDRDECEPAWNMASCWSFLEFVKANKVLVNPSKRIDVNNPKSKGTPIIIGNTEGQNAIEQTIGFEIKIVDDQESLVGNADMEYQILILTNAGLHFDRLLESASKGYSLSTILFIVVDFAAGSNYLAKEYPSVFINIDDIVKGIKPIRPFTNNDKYTGSLSVGDIVSQKLILEEFKKGTFNDKIVFCHSSDHLELLPYESYTVLNGRYSTFNQFVRELILRLTSRLDYWEELYSILKILIYIYSDNSLLRMNDEQRYDWLVNRLIDRSSNSDRI